MRAWRWILALVCAGAWLARAEPLPDEIVVGLEPPGRARGVLVSLPDGSVDGYAKRVLEEAAEAAGLRVRFAPLGNDDGLGELTRGEIDLIAPMSIVEARMDEVSYTAPMFVARGAVYARRGTEPARRESDLRGKRIVVARLGVAHEWLAAKGIEFTPCVSLSRAIEAVRSGEADYLLTTQVAGRVELQAKGITGLLEWELEDESFWRAFAFAARRDDAPLVAALNRGMAVLRESGRLDELYDEWVGAYQPRHVRAAVPLGAALWAAGGAASLVGAAWLAAWVTRRQLASRSAELARRDRELRDLEARTEEAQARLNDVAETVESVVWLYDAAEKKLLYANPAFERAWGQTLEALWDNPRAWLERVHPDDRERVEREIERAQREGNEYEIEYRVLRQGEVRWYRSRSRPVGGQGGTRRAGVAHDITDLKRAELALREREAGYRSIFQGSNDAIIVIDPRRECVAAANPAACEMYGYSMEQLVGMPLERLSAEWGTGRARLQVAVERGAIGPFVARQRRSDGTVMDVEIVGSAIEFQGAPAVISLGRVVTDRLRAEQQLRQSEERYRAFVSTSVEGVWRCELSEPIDVSLAKAAQIDLMYERAVLAECNDAFARMYGYKDASEIVGTRLSALLVREDPMNQEYLAAFVEAGYRLSDVMSHEKDAKGNSRYFSNSLVGIVENGKLTRAWGTQRDVTAVREAEMERRVMQERLDRAVRLETLGLLSGGIAHDINNILAAIMGNAGLVRKKTGNSEDIRPHLHMIEEAVTRGSDLTRQLLASAGKGPTKREAFDLYEVAARTVELLACAIDPHHALQLEARSARVMVMGDATQVRQVIMNLVRNAAEAMGEQRGAIAVRVMDEAPAPGDDWTVVGDCAAAESACIEVSDEGPGIADPGRGRIFEPFYSSKGPGRGLGLAATLGIVRGHGGAIMFRSVPGKGTTFRVFLPRAEASDHEEVSGENLERSAGCEAGMVLVVDDDRSVRDVFCECLQGAGFSTLSASDGDAGIEVFKARGAEIGAVVLDMVMPRKGGEETFREIRSMRGDIPVIVISGHAGADALARLAAEPGVMCLSKPLEPSALIAAVGKIVASGRVVAG